MNEEDKEKKMRDLIETMLLITEQDYRSLFDSRFINHIVIVRPFVVGQKGKSERHK